MNFKKDSDKVIHKAVNHELPGFDFNNNHKWHGSFTFIQMADTQYGLTEDFRVGNDNVWDIEIAYSKKCIELIHQMNPPPAFVIICGDMINSFPGLPNRENQISDFIKTFRELSSSIPLICVCGNHDVGNSPTKATLAEYHRDFGDDYFRFWWNGVKFLAINSQFYHDRSNCKEEASEQDYWLEKELDKAENKHARHLIVFQHIPWFIKSVDEPADNYFNIQTEVRREMLERFANAGVSKVFAGHTHRNAGGRFTSENGKVVELVITSAVGYQLGDDQHGFRVVTVEEQAIEHKYCDVLID